MTQTSDNGQSTPNLFETPEAQEADKNSLAQAPTKDAGAKGTGIRRRLFPMHKLEDALRITEVIRDKNGGNPWPPSEVAAALNMGARTNDFYAFTAMRWMALSRQGIGPS
jgi:hypothetical protein